MTVTASPRGSGLVWIDPPPRPRLKPDQVHVWRASLDVDPSRASGLLATLSPGEKDRARRFHFLEDQSRCVAARAILRHLLGLYLDLRPTDLRLSRGAFGKPSLADAGAGDGIRFNLSHSGGLALYAFVLGREVGIDVELTTCVHVDELASAGFLSEGEERQLRALQGPPRQEALLRCWTRKEAYLKAIGEGMGAPLMEVEVSLLPESPALLRAPGGEKEIRRWSLLDLVPAPGYAACLAVEGVAQVVCWEWQWPDRKAEAEP
jgi:4'-phosphopantetheinyl transferase